MDKTCTECDKIKSVTNFTSEDERTTNWCDECVKIFDQYVINLLKNTYVKAKNEGVDCDLTTDDIKTIYFKQNGKCSLSGMKMSFK